MYQFCGKRKKFNFVEVRVYVKGRQLTSILLTIMNATGMMHDSRFSNATTPKNQHTAKAGWKNNENMQACLNSA